MILVSSYLGCQPFRQFHTKAPERRLSHRDRRGAGRTKCVYISNWPVALGMVLYTYIDECFQETIAERIRKRQRKRVKTSRE